MIEGSGHGVEGRSAHHAVSPPGGEAIVTSYFWGRIPDERTKNIGERVDEDISRCSSQKDWHQRLGSGVHADAIMDRIIHNTIWVETGTYNMREHTALATA
ncbi:hypothetical protein [Cryobacterium sp. M23]|uniref:hypothetical protein n=1 Tax=Cryobacterium sp. M23 TaxID=2048292 RepID=UPI0027121199|nr:hypothetical protein [Cryobacterium sp. M23]